MPQRPAYDRTPRLVSDVNLRALELSPTDAFVLSCIDGVCREPELVEITGLDRELVSEILTRLFELGAITLGTDRPPAPNPNRVVAPSTSGAHRIGAVRELIEAGAAHHPAAHDEPVEPAVELAPALQRRVLEKLAELARCNHYELLGVPADSDLKSIRRAYFELANVFHPDRHFRKELGSFRSKLEQVFTRITEAYAVLGRAQSRAQYDRYLSLSNRSRQLDDSVRQAAAAEARVARPAPSLPPSSDARRRALARKLGQSSAPPPTRASVPPTEAAASAPPPSARELAENALRERYQQRIQLERHGQLERYLERAADADERRDWVAAANALRLACALRPDDATLTARLAEFDQKAVSSLWQEYLERAQYEEEGGQFQLAAHSYERAAAGHVDARLFERAAACWVAAGREPRRATELARRAVELARDNPQCRLTLARCFIAAGMRESALAELSRALELAPKDKALKDLVRQIERSAE